MICGAPGVGMPHCHVVLGIFRERGLCREVADHAETTPIDERRRPVGRRGRDPQTQRKRTV